MNITNIVEIIDQEQVKEIAMQFTDLSGVLHTLWIPSTHFPEIIKEGTHTDGSSFGMVDVSKSDLKLIPDLDSIVVCCFTIRIIPSKSREGNL
ncbi:MAG: glutamine synthetase beta-grasp domain-containing protein [Candidatus Hodarchaeales archaeon]|jgi:glutamine synthetase